MGFGVSGSFALQASRLKVDIWLAEGSQQAQFLKHGTPYHDSR